MPTDWLGPGDWLALWVSIKLAGVSTAILLLISLPIAWWLSHSQSRWKIIIEPLIALPLVLPPTVLGFYLLILLRPDGAVSQALAMFGIQPLVFSFSGLVVGSLIYSLPFVVQPLQNSMQSLGDGPIELAATLGAGSMERLFFIVLPLIRPGILTAAALGFAHTLGEFGVVLMIGGNIEGETRVASIAIYEEVETLDFSSAHRLSLSLLALCFALLLPIYYFRRRTSQAPPLT